MMKGPEPTILLSAFISSVSASTSSRGMMNELRSARKCMKGEQGFLVVIRSVWSSTTSIVSMVSHW